MIQPTWRPRRKQITNQYYRAKLRHIYANFFSASKARKNTIENLYQRLLTKRPLNAIILLSSVLIIKRCFSGDIETADICRHFLSRHITTFKHTSAIVNVAWRSRLPESKNGYAKQWLNILKRIRPSRMGTN